MNRIKELRLSQGMKQIDFAKMLGVSQATVSGWEIEKYQPDQDALIRMASYFDVSVDYLIGNSPIRKEKKKGIQIPVLGEVRAGYPVEAVENIIDYEEIDEELARHGEYFALRIKGDSMEPRFTEGDVVIVRKQQTADSGDIVVALVNGDSATIKKLKRHQNGITLVASNPAYEPMYYSNEEIMELPVIILGRVVELRAKF